MSEFYEITVGKTIHKSIIAPDHFHIFHQANIQVPNINEVNYVIISSDTKGNGPIIVDDGIFVNGKFICKGFSGLTTDPMRYLEHSASAAYQPISPVVIEPNHFRGDGLFCIQLVDMGGYTYCSSPLYLVVKRQTNEE